MMLVLDKHQQPTLTSTTTNLPTKGGDPKGRQEAIPWLSEAEPGQDKLPAIGLSADLMLWRKVSPSWAREGEKEDKKCH